MRILYDHQAFQMQKFGGISRYFVELMSRLPNDVQVSSSVVFSENTYLKNSVLSKGIVISDFKGKNRISYRSNRLFSEVALYRGKYDLFHPTYYDPYFLKYLKRPYVITVYDMIHEKFSNKFSENDPTRAFKKKTILNANRIIAISQKTKEDIIDIYGLSDERIDVVHLGHSIDNSNVTVVDNIPKDYILFVGQRGGYKNFDNFLKAYALLNRQFQDIKLVCTGRPFNKEENELLNSLGIKHNVSNYFVTDSQLTYLYKNAICFVYPSLYEGFGIPILEAFAAECPLALSKTSCFPEIARDGGEYFDPYEVGSIADSLIRIVSDSELRKDMISRGKKVLEFYSWDKMAFETYEIYKKIVG